jgi:glycosyltransferase involved in cell wall biosynthesis
VISILLPTYHRPSMLREMLKSLRHNTAGHDIEVIAVIDDDNESQEIATLYEVDVIDYSSSKRGALWAWNRALHLSDGDILVPCGDDQIFYANWLDYALESHRKRCNGYGVVGMNDLAYNGNTQVATMFLFDRKYCKDVMGGIFAPPMYEYLCVDLEWNEKAKMLGHFCWDERSIIEHLHSAHGKRPIDELDLVKNEGMVERDTATYNDRKARGFPIEWEPVI